jgi:serine/threonine protein phosphatase PrpC
MAISHVNFDTQDDSSSEPVGHEQLDAPGAISAAPVFHQVSLAPRRHVSVRPDFAARTDRGLARFENQDTFLIDRGLGLAVLCDGMGGHAGGGRASALAAHAFKDAIIAGKPLVRSYADHQRPELVQKREISALLQEAADAASRAVHEEAAVRAQCAKMGTTLVAVLLLDNHAFIVNVGDSRGVYLLRGASLEQVTRDHTVYAELLRSGQLRPGAYPRSGFRNILTRAVGTKEHCDADSVVIDVLPGDRILLCSDGVHQYLDPPDGSTEELRRELSQKDGQSAADALIDFANARGGCDDMTAVVLTLGMLGDYDADELGALAGRYDALARSPLFVPLDERERSSILALAEVRRFERGETIIGPEAMGGDMYVLLRGSVHVEQREGGAFQLELGQLVVAESWMNAGQCSTRAVASTASELLVLPRQELFRLFRTDADLAEKILRCAVRRTLTQS